MNININDILPNRMLGDTFTNNIIKTCFRSKFYPTYQQLYIRGNFSKYNNSYVFKDRMGLNYQMIYGFGADWYQQHLDKQNWKFDLCPQLDSS